jgi:uncharacterized protein YgiM (DUF1202 family)
MLKQYLLIRRFSKGGIFLLLLCLVLTFGCTDSSSTSPNSRSAFAPTSPVADSQPAEAANVQTNGSAKADASVISTKANLREGPGKTYASLLELEKGDALNLQGRRTGAWYSVIHVRSGKVGWVHGNSIKLLDPQAITSTTQPKLVNTSPRPSSTQISRTDTSTSRRPVRSDSAPEGASARCNDGTYSFSQNRRGTCSHHGGVAEWL